MEGSHPEKEGTLRQDLKKLIRLISAPSNNTLTPQHQKRAPPCARRQLDDGRVFWNVTASFPAVWTFPARAAQLPLHWSPYFQRPCSSCSKAQWPKRVSAAGLPAWLARIASSPVTRSTCWTWAPSHVAGCLRTANSTARAALRRTWSHSDRSRKTGLAAMNGRTRQRMMGTRHSGETWGSIHCLTKVKRNECVDSTVLVRVITKYWLKPHLQKVFRTCNNLVDFFNFVLYVNSGKQPVWHNKCVSTLICFL